MFCDVCGNKVDDVTMICGNCGHKLNVMETGGSTQMLPVNEISPTAPAGVIPSPAALAGMPMSAVASAAAPVAPAPAAPSVNPVPVPGMPAQNPVPVPGMPAQNPMPVQNPEQIPNAAPISYPNGPQLSKEQIASIANGAANGSNGGNNGNGGKSAGKGGSGGFFKKFRFLFIGIAVLAVVGIILAANFKTIANAVVKSQDSDVYFKWVAKNYVTENVNSMVAVYDDYVDAMNFSDKEMVVNASVEVGEDAEKYLKLMKRAGYDFTWVETADIKYDINVKDEVVCLDVAGSFNGVEVLAIESIADINKEQGYTGFPSLSSAYGVYEERGFDDITEELDEMQAIIDAIPDKNAVKKIFVNYMETAINQVKKGNVKVSDKTIRAGGITQDVTAVTLTIDNDLCRNMAIAVVQQMQEDKDLRKLVEQFVKDMEDTDFAYEYDLDDFDYDDFLDELSDLEEELEDADFLVSYDWRKGEEVEEEIKFTLYVNNKGELVGSEAEYESSINSYEKYDVKMIKVQKGSDVAYKYDDDMMSITAVGKERMHKFTGTVDIEYSALDIATIEVSDFDVKAVDKGQLTGKFAITLDDSVFRYNAGASRIEDMTIVLDCDMAIKSGKVSVELLDDDNLVAKFKIDYKSSKGSKIKIPSGKDVIDMEEDDAGEELFETFDLKDLVKRLEKANVPEDFIEEIEEIEDYDDFEDFLDDLRF